MQETNSEMLFSNYCRNWISIYKEGAIRDVTLNKYLNSLAWIEKLAPSLKLKDINRIYQRLCCSS